MPYLLDLTIEALSCLLKRAKDDGFLPGYQVRDRGYARVEVSHPLFVDDNIVFMRLLRTN